MKMGKAEALALRDVVAIECAFRHQPAHWAEIRDAAIRLAALASNRASREA